MADQFLQHRIADPRLLRLIRKWLKAGILADGKVEVNDRGTPQGAVISPLLANVYLHYAFDLWADRWRRREVTGNVVIVRYADDIVVGFEHEADAVRFRRDGARLASVLAHAPSGQDAPDPIRPPCGGRTGPGAASANRKPLPFSASPSCVASHCGAGSCSYG